MDKNKQYYFKECINMVTKSEKYNHNVLLIKHCNILNINVGDIGSEGIFHSYKKSEVLKPYEPFLDIIKGFLEKKSAGFIDDFIKQADVYPLHKNIFMQYFRGELCERREELLLGEYLYEKRKFQYAVLNMLSIVARENSFYIVLDEINMAGSSANWMLTEIARQPQYQHIKIIAILNEEGESLSFAEKELETFIELCEENSMVDHWFYEEEILPDENFRKSSMEISECIAVFNNLLYTLECEQAEYFLKDFFEKKARKKITLEVAQQIQILKIDYWLNLIKEEYAYALHLCTEMMKLSETNDEKNSEVQFQIISLKVLVHIYNEDIEQANRELLLCEKIALENEDEKMLFKLELMKNMLEYSGWKNLWICDKEVPVSDDFINNCFKYGYLNHLAHIYAYSFNSNFDLFRSMENMEEKLSDFNKGIAIGKKIKNGKFLVDAYRKNVMLASSNGYFDICIYFYKKMLKVAKRNNDEIEEAAIYNGLGYSNCGIERYKEANKYYSKALSLYYKYQMPDDIVETLYNLGINAMQAGNYNNACSYLLEGDFILRTLKKSTLRVCDISKLYGLIALASIRVGNVHQARLYLNKAREFLSDVFSVNDSMFLVHFLLGKLKYRDKKYEEAKECFDKAEVYMKRVVGSLFFNYFEFIYDYYQLLMDMGMQTEAQRELEDFCAYCKKNQYNYKLNKIYALINKEAGKNNSDKFDMMLDKIDLEDISDFIYKKRDEKERLALVKTIRFFDVLQKFTNHMSDNIKKEIATIIPVFKNCFSIDKVFLIRITEQKSEVLYGDLGYKISPENIAVIMQYFQDRTVGFMASKGDIKHEEYKKVMACFDITHILSFAAVPIYENEKLMCVAIVFNELKTSTIVSREKSFIEESDLEIFTYIFHQISNAVDKIEMENELVETNKKINEQIEQVLTLKNEAEVANVAKSNFLANMSHEIRTPMNAIIGMAEVVLRGNLSDEQRENVQQIKDSGKALLAIINDILDISKVESGKMDIIVEKYYLHSIIRDVATIIVTRIGDKKINFIVDIAPDIPQELLGDCVRIRQIIINLANNAIKFTKQGMVKLLLDYEYTSEEEIMMRIVVEDTGIGIKKSDMAKLFTSFQQVDSKRNRNIEGTGLGLSITKQLLTLMGGEITVESEYGKGTTFTCRLPQKIAANTDNNVDNSKEEIKVAIYIEDVQVKAQLEKDLKRMGVYYEVILSEKELLELTGDRVNYIFVETSLLTEDIIGKMENESDIKGVLLKDFKTSYGYTLKNLLVLNKPIYSLEIKGLFYGTADYINDIGGGAYLEFTAPDAEILIVDDNTINLKVAVGMLEPLNMKIDTAISGKEAVEKISTKKYDIIFMDHMMPEIDGVETTHIIRRFYVDYNDVPIIALTANAVSGIKEYFISEGMNDFVAKPIDMVTIVSKIRTWLPKEKIREGQPENATEKSITNTAIHIEGLDTDYALKLVGKEKVYWNVLGDYYQNIDTKIALIDGYEKKEDIKAYTIEVHALKSASRQIGALELATDAEALEKAGKSENIEMIHEKTPDLLKKYGEYKKILMPYFDKTDAPENEADKQLMDSETLQGIFKELKEALDELDLNKMDVVMEKMAQYKYSEKEEALYEQLKSSMERIDSEACEEIITQWERVLF